MQKLPMFGVDLKKLVKEGHISLEISTMFGPKKANGYRSNNLDLTPEVKKQVEKLYFKLYPTNEKFINNEFGHKLCWRVVAKRENVVVNWALLGLNIAKQKAQRMKGPQVYLGRVGVEEKGAIAKTKGIAQNQNPKKSFQGLNVMANHARRPQNFTTDEIFGVELCELKKVELIVAKFVISNLLQLKSELEAKVKHLHSQMEDRKVACAKAKMEMDILVKKISAQKKEVEKLQEILVGFGGGEQEFNDLNSSIQMNVTKLNCLNQELDYHKKIFGGLHLELLPIMSLVKSMQGQIQTLVK